MLNGILLNDTFSYDTPVAQTVEKVNIKSVDISKSQEDGILIATVKIDENAWKKNYDMIYLGFHEDSPGADKRIVGFPRGCTQASFDFSSVYIFWDNESDRTVYVYGIKNNKISEASSFTIEKKEIGDTTYDNERPVFYGAKMDGENYYIKIDQDSSGFAPGGTATVINKSFGKITVDGKPQPNASSFAITCRWRDDTVVNPDYLSINI